MTKKTIDDEIDKFLKDDSAQNKAVSALIDVKEREKGKLGSDIELKTDLNTKDICLHTAIDIMDEVLKMTPEEFLMMPIGMSVTEKKERKSVSKDRKSRTEIVNVARQPDMNTIMSNENTGVIKRFFTPRR